MNPPRTRSWWLTICASAGVSLEVGMSVCVQRMMRSAYHGFPTRARCAHGLKTRDTGKRAGELPLGLLLRQAVDRAKAPDEFGAIDADDSVLREVALKNFGRALIVLSAAVGRHEHRAVDEVEVRVRGRESLAVVLHDAGHGELDDAERLSVLI